MVWRLRCVAVRAAAAGILDRLPWPNVRGKRCLAITAKTAATGDERVEDALRARGAAEVDVIDDVSASLDERLALGRAADRPPYDVVVCVGVLAAVRDPLAAMTAVRQVTRGVALSLEPLEPILSLLARGIPLYTPAPPGSGDVVRFNGTGHRRLLELAGFAVERVSAPLALGDPAPMTSPRARAEHLIVRALTRGQGAGRLHRAMLARPVS
jgi:hypothetical protein